MKPTIYTCVTCRYSVDEREHEGQTGGELLAQWIETLAAKDPERAPFTRKTTRCFMNCKGHCNVHLRAPGKLSYVLGRLPPTRDGATAVLAFFDRYLASEDGRVPKSERPEAVRNGFLVRIPPWENDPGPNDER